MGGRERAQRASTGRAPRLVGGGEAERESARAGRRGLGAAEERSARSARAPDGPPGSLEERRRRVRPPRLRRRDCCARYDGSGSDFLSGTISEGDSSSRLASINARRIFSITVISVFIAI